MTEFHTHQGYQIPKIGLGTWQARGNACTQAVDYALSAGYRHIDTAQIYENEAEVGQGIKQSSTPRSDIFLTTKVWMDKVADGDLQRSVDESLQKLGTDYVDLLLIHWPVEDVPLEQQIKALELVKNAGKAKLIGVSNFTLDWLEQAAGIADNLACNQVEYHPFLSQSMLLDWLKKHQMFLTAYCPLARGDVSGKDALSEIGLKYQKSPAQVALRWLVQQEAVVAIPKSATQSHIKANIDIFDFELSGEEMTAMFTLTQSNKRIINPEWAPAWDKAA